MQKTQLSEAHNLYSPKTTSSLNTMATLYLDFVVGSSTFSTFEAKNRDLRLFVDYANDVGAALNIQRWTPSLSKGFQESLLSRYKPATVKRTMATLKHFSAWLKGRMEFLIGDPMAGVIPLKLDEPAWNGLSKSELFQLRSAVDMRLASCKRRDQNPRLEAAVFYLLLFTGLRESELVNLNIEQYSEGRALLNVRRKGKRIMSKMALSKDAVQYLNTYLAQEEHNSGDPLFKSRGGNRLSRFDVVKICNRIALLTPTRIKLTPHMLRHTFLKRVTDKHGVHVAQKLSGNVSVAEIFRYAKPSEDEVHEVVEGLF